jgi:hypothetical protein
MTVQIYRLTGEEAYDLIFDEHLAKLSDVEQESMHRTMKNSSRVWLGADESKVIAVWGLIPPTILSDTAYLWLFTTHYMHEHVFIFIRHSKRAVESMLKEFPIIVGHTSVTNHRAMQWLRWLGAKYGDPQGQFIPFKIEATQWQQDSAQSA